MAAPVRVDAVEHRVEGIDVRIPARRGDSDGAIVTTSIGRISVRLSSSLRISCPRSVSGRILDTAALTASRLVDGRDYVVARVDEHESSRQLG
jgi:hypothetical protein